MEESLRHRLEVAEEGRILVQQDLEELQVHDSMSC